MDIKFRTRKLPEYKVVAKEVVKVLNDLPHLLVRVEVSGEHFPYRATHPFIRIKIGNEGYFNDLFTEVSPDNQKLIGYFPANLPAHGSIEFGYGAEIWGIVPGEFRTESVLHLDRKRLPKDIVIINDDFSAERKRGNIL